MLTFSPRHGPRRRIAGSIPITCALLLSSVLATARAEHPATPEYALKAAFIYNFARFTAWPERPDKLLHLCILGRDPFGSALDAIDNKEIGKLHIAVKRLRNPDEAMRACQIVFITDAEVAGFQVLPETVRVAGGVLTIADREGAARQGIIIEMTTDERKIGFEFNQDSARQARVDISSKLLRLARKVY
jgi:hypothetical protein